MQLSQEQRKISFTSCHLFWFFAENTTQHEIDMNSQLCSKVSKKRNYQGSQRKNHRNGSTDTVVGKKRKLICGGGMVRPAEAISDTLLHIAQTPIKRNERRARDPLPKTGLLSRTTNIANWLYLTKINRKMENVF